MKKRTTASDVAKLSGVSTITVSRYINCPHKLALNTKTRIQEAIETLNYHPNLVAKAMNEGRTNSIYLRIPNDIPATNPFYLHLVSGVAEELGEQGFSLLMGRKNYDNSQSVDGLIYTGAVKEEIREIQKLAKKMPIVLFGNIAGVASIDVDNYYGEYNATKKTVQNRDQSVIYISIDQDRDFVKERERGFFAAMREINSENYVVYKCQNNNSVAYDLAIANMKIFSQAYAIICASDDIAIGVGNALASYVPSVLKRIKLAGFDGLGVEKNMIPNIMTVRQPIFEIGQMLAKRIIEMVKNQTSDTCLELVKPVFVES